MKEFFEIIHQHPLIAFCLGVFILTALDKITDALIVIFKKK